MKNIIKKIFISLKGVKVIYKNGAIHEIDNEGNQTLTNVKLIKDKKMNKETKQFKKIIKRRKQRLNNIAHDKAESLGTMRKIHKATLLKKYEK